MSQIIMPYANLIDAVDVVLADGYVAVEGTKTPAVRFCSRIIDALAPYEDISPAIIFQMVANHGYLYMVVDFNRYSPDDREFRRLVDSLDLDNPVDFSVFS